MFWSGSSSPLAVVRGGMWGFLLFVAAAWLAIAWSVLRLEPSDIAHVAGPVVLFGALTEAVRSLAGTRTWWLNAGMAALFAVTGVVLLADQDSSFTTPAALLGWYLMVRGAADIAMAMMTRETDRIWGLLMVVGVLETSLGFFAAGPLARTAGAVVAVLGGLALARGVADLVASLRLREAGLTSSELFELPPERAAGVSGYSAGRADVESVPVLRGARHRAATKPVGERVADLGEWAIAEVDRGLVGSLGTAITGGMAGAAGDTRPTAVDRRADDADRAAAGRRADDANPAAARRRAGDTERAASGRRVGDSKPATAGRQGSNTESTSTGRRVGDAISATVRRLGSGIESAPGGRRADDAQPATASRQTGDPEPASGRRTGDAAPATTGGLGGNTEPTFIGGPAAEAEPAPAAWTPAPEWTGAAGCPQAVPTATRGAAAASGDASSFHEEVLRTTADLDAILALAGVTGAAMGAGLVIHPDMPEVPDTPEGVERADTAELKAVREH
jgi:Short repeat of unknown function (DUF308)